MPFENNRSDLFYDPFVGRNDDFDKKFNKIDRKISRTSERRRSSGSLNDRDRDKFRDEVRSERSEDFEESEDEPDEGFGTAPPIDILDRIKGYEMVSFDTTSVPPPIEVSALIEEADGPIVAESGQEGGPEATEAGGQTKEKKTVVLVQEIGTKLSEQQVRAALLSHISHQCCYGTTAAKNMTIKSMEYLAAYHYELQTFTEKRETAWTYAALKSGYESCGSSGGGLVPPLPWEIEEDPVQAFKDEVRLIEVPHTESSKTCHRCRGTGGVKCQDCSGKGWVRCLHCHGNGWMADSGGHKERCFYCQHSRNGHGQQDCTKCHTKGKVNCQTCEGHGQIRCFIQLSITWKVHTADHIVERLNLPSDLIRDASGQVAFEEDGPRVKAVDLDLAFSSSTPEDGQSRTLLIKEASSDLVSKHLTAFSLDQKVIRQRHQVRIVPVTRIHYEWKSKAYIFYVYGYENKVHLLGYPDSCCWGCKLL